MKEEYRNKTVGELKKLNVSLKDIGFDSSSLDNLRETFLRIQEEIKRVTEPFRKISEVLKKINPKFIEEDWYLSEPVFRQLSFVNMYSASSKQLEKELLNIFKNDYSEIKERVIYDNLTRESILKELFNVFQKRHYHSVVLLSYSITDGISKEKFGLKFWGYDNKSEKTMSKKISEQLETESVYGLIQKQLNSRGELTQKDDQIPSEKKKSSYNRNCVIHGDSYLYGTRVNAVKSILLLDFISSLNPNL